jgi:DNA-directed RNA polymerase I, II, and III subunit RPABC2
MSSYFDNQYGGEDPDDTFKCGDSDNEYIGSDYEDEDENEDKKIKKNINDEDLEEEPEDLEDEDDELEDEDKDLEDEDEEEELEEEEDLEGGAGDSELEDGEIDENDNENENEDKPQRKKVKKIPAKNVYKNPSDYIDNDEDDDDDGEQYLQKFDRAVNENYILNFHPESILQNYDEILTMTKVVRNADGIVVDSLHRTIPYLTKYEKARILGQRAKQINSGAYPFVKVPENVIDGYLIAELELKQKRIPFIIRRPLPNGGSEYWCVKDLEDIMF